jgi:hypothetical protein
MRSAVAMHGAAYVLLHWASLVIVGPTSCGRGHWLLVVFTAY